MGFFDTVKDKAGALAADTQRAGKVTAAQARLVVLQNDLKKAERELGHAAFALAERGELDHPDLAHAIERLRATMAEVHGKEAEIAALRGEAAPAETPMSAAPPRRPRLRRRRRWLRRGRRLLRRPSPRKRPRRPRRRSRRPPDLSPSPLRRSWRRPRRRQKCSRPRHRRSPSRP